MGKAIFTPDLVRRLGVFAPSAGVRYADSGRVRSLEVAGNLVSATFKQG